MNRREAEELLPWFVAGTLSRDEAQAVQAFIDSGEIPAADLESLALFAETVAEKGADEPAYDPAILKRAMARLDDVVQEQAELPLVVGEAHTTRSSASDASDAVSPGLLKRLLDLLQWSTTPPLARVLVAAQFALLLGLVIVVAGRDSLPEAPTYQTVSGTPEQRADFSLSFAPGAGEAELRAMLLEQGLSIVAGPSALGLYQVAAAPGSDLEAIDTALAANPLVVYVQQVPKP